MSVSIPLKLKGFLDAISDLFATEHMREQRWLREGRQLGATHVILRWDSFEAESIPQYVMPDEDVSEIATRIRQGGAYSVGKILKVPQD